MQSSSPICKIQPSARLRKLAFGRARVCPRRHRPGSRPWSLVAMACGLFFGNTAQAATASFTNNVPTLGPGDISQLTNASDRTNNVGGTVDDQGGNFVYLDNQRPAQGQTFTTGGNANGYALTAVTLKQV